jgi:hypothetical protein
LNTVIDTLDVGLNSKKSEIFMSPLTTILKRNDTQQTQAVQLVFGPSELEITLTPKTLWEALRNVGAMLSLMFTYAAIAGCSHIQKFNASLQKSYYRVTRMLKKENGYKPPSKETEGKGEPDPENELSISETSSFLEYINKMPESEKKRLELEFQDNYSFGRYLDLIYRVEYLEARLNE